jgi:hypothetical protein
VVLLTAFAGSVSPARAGGPGFVTAAGQPYRWPMTQPLRYVVAPGPFGSRTHAWAVDLVSRAYAVWQAVPTARLQVTAAGELPRSITGSSLMPFLNGLQPGDPTAVLFDNDGSSLDTLLGQGVSAAVLGIGFPYIADPNTGQISVSFVILNGKLDQKFSDNYVFGSFTHELGHSLDMAHSQVNADELTDGDPTNDALAPAMFYRGPNDSGGLSLDDQAWISWLYPSPGFAATTGAIRGRVLLPDGVTGLQGIQVVARRVGDPQVTAVGSVSGFYFRNAPIFGLGGGDPDPARMGEFMIPGLPPGSYTVELTQLAGFPTVPVPVGYLVGGPKFWHQGSSAQDDPNASSLVEVKAGLEVTGVDIVVNGDNLGNPKPVAERAPNMLPNPQSVNPPVVISGSVESVNGAPAGHDIQSTDDLQRVYSFYLNEPMLITGILSAGAAGADLDLFVLGEDSGRLYIGDASAQDGTPPEVVQDRLPPGRYYVGVHQAGNLGTGYTLRLLATPAPDPTPASEPLVISYLLIGDVTPTTALAHWVTDLDAPSILYYNLPVREIGSTKLERVHALSMTDLAPGSQTEVDVLAGTPAGGDELGASLTTATAPAAGGSPHIVATSTHLQALQGVELVTVYLSNTGTGDARSVSIQQVIPASGWVFGAQVITGAQLPPSFDLGGIGAGGAGSFTALLLQSSGSSTAGLTLHGSYTDASGTPRAF